MNRSNGTESGSGGTADIVRQASNVVGAVAQVTAGAIVGPAVGAVANENRSLILPSGYAFSIWSVIFLLFAIYAVYQAMPSHRTDPLLRTIGPWTAAATIGNAVWTLLFPNRLYVLAQLLIVAIAVCAIVALQRYAAWSSRQQPTRFQRWVIGLAVGLLAGWGTAASFVGVAATLIAGGVAATGEAAALGAAGLLLFGGGVAIAVLLAARTGAPVAWLAYGAATVWALIAVAANNAARSGLIAAVALAVAAALVVLAATLWRDGSGGQPAPGAVA